MVIIENLDSLKAWLVKRLTPMCDADPNALAKYVVALVKKDKSEEDLRKLCADQLEVFLQTQTANFVTELFEVLKNKNYGNDNVDAPVVKEKDEAEEMKTEQQVKKPKRRLNRPSPIRHRSRSPYDRRRRIKRSRSPRDRRRRSYRSHSGSPKRGRMSPKRRSPIRRSRSRSPHRRGRRARSLSSSRSRSSSRSPDSSNQKASIDDRSMKKRRCLDYDLKGFCMLGDNCPFDHGKDPVVVEDTAISSTSRPVVGPPKIPPITAPPPLVPPMKPNVPPPVLPPPFLPPPVGIPVPPPGMRLPMPPPVPPPPGTIRIPPPGILSMPPRSQPPPGYNPEAPGLSYSIDRRQNVPSSVPPPVSGIGSNSRSIITAPPPMTAPVVRPMVYNSAPAALQNTGPRNHFNSNNSKLVIRKIPPALNNITKLNEHFSKFGAINNIQVKFENDPQSALVEYAHVNSARAAKRDTGAVMNNRFIMVYWYNAQGASNGGTPQTRPSVKDRLGALPNPSQLKYTAPGKDAKPSNQTDSSVVASGTIYRTITNNTKATTNSAPQKVKNIDEVNEKERNETKSKVQKAQQATKEKLMARQKIMLQKKIELQKQKRELLEAQMAQQKLFLNKIKAATSPTEKKRLMNSLKALTVSIDKLRTSLKGEGSYNPLDAKEKQQKAQKEVLDAELDLYNASTTGESTSDLKRKLNQLKMEASSLGLVNTYKGGWGAGRGRGRGGYVPRAKVPRVFSSSANLDRRPREIRVSGFHEDEKDELISHLARFGEIETFSFGDDDITCTVKFQMRSQAEAASSHGSAFKNRRLIIVWTSGNASAVTTEAKAATAPVAVAEGNEENQETPAIEQALVVPGGDKDVEDDDDDDDENDNVNVHIGEVTTSFTGDLEDDEDDHFEDELDEDALLAADFDEDVGDDQDFEDEELRSWRR